MKKQDTNSLKRPLPPHGQLVIEPKVDFTAYKVPWMAVPCPICLAGTVGKACQRPSEHGVFGGKPHDARGKEADRIFFLQHGDRATITQENGRWVIDPFGLPQEAEQSEPTLF